MTVVLLDQEMDRAEAFRLSKKIRLPEEIVLSSDGSIPRAFAFYRILGLDSYPVVRVMMRSQLDVGMSETLGSVDIPYADRLSHLVDLDDPVTFYDLRDLPQEDFRAAYRPYPTSAPDRDSGADGPRSEATQDLAAGACNAGRLVGAGAPAGPDDGPLFPTDAEGVGFSEAVRS